jgi:hypothetical protein
MYYKGVMQNEKGVFESFGDRRGVCPGVRVNRMHQHGFQ